MMLQHTLHVGVLRATEQREKPQTPLPHPEEPGCHVWPSVAKDAFGKLLAFPVGSEQAIC